MTARPRPRLLELVPARGEAERADHRPAEPGDAELVERAVGADRWAEEALYRRHARAITGAVLRMVGSRSDADDIVQDTFVIAFRRLGDLRDGASFRAWVAKIAVNEIRRTLRKRALLRWAGLDRRGDGRHEEEIGFAALAVQGTRPDLRAELAELDRILTRLPTEQRMVWLFHRVEGWSLSETAAALDISTATVKRRLGAADSAIEVSRTGRGWTT